MGDTNNTPFLIQLLVQNEIGDVSNLRPQPERGCQGEDSATLWEIHAKSVATAVEGVNML